MANFLRNETIENILIDEDKLRQINDAFSSRLKNINSRENLDDKKRAFITYVIRFDEKGYRVFDFNDLLQYFHQAKKIEHIIFTLETGESLSSTRRIGVCLELTLNQINNLGCYLLCTSDDKDWVDATFSTIKDILYKCKNWNWLARTTWTQLIVQIFGVSLGFIISFWISAKIASKLSIENSFVICFLFVLLIFSNAWGFMNARLIKLIYAIFPSVKLYRPDKDRVHWLMQAMIGGIALAVTLWILNVIFSYIGDILSAYVKK